MTENLSAFDYKTQEEPLAVIYRLTKILSTTGTQVVELVLPSSLMAELHGDVNVMQVVSNNTGVEYVCIDIKHPLLGLRT
jgi:hypothetical protein